MAEKLDPFRVDRTLTDAKGRRLGVRDLDVVEKFDLYEIAGTNSTNTSWLGTAMMVCSVRMIDDRPWPYPTKRDHLRSSLRTLGDEGMDALRNDLLAQSEADEAAAESALLAGGGGLSPEDQATKN